MEHVERVVVLVDRINELFFIQFFGFFYLDLNANVVDFYVLFDIYIIKSITSNFFFSEGVTW